MKVLKKVIVTMMIVIFVFGINTMYAKEVSNDNAIKSNVIKLSKDKNSSSIEIISSVDNLESANEIVNSYILENQEVGVEKVVQTYNDGSKLSLTVQEEPIMAGITSATTLQSQRTFNYTFINPAGQRQDAFSVLINVTYVKDGANGYIMSTKGTYTRYNTLFTLSWGASSSTAYVHTLDLSAAYMASTNYHMFMSSYSPFDGSLSISAY